jgi:hypothetical protein
MGAHRRYFFAMASRLLPLMGEVLALPAGDNSELLLFPPPTISNRFAFCDEPSVAEKVYCEVQTRLRLGAGVVACVSV